MINNNSTKKMTIMKKMNKKICKQILKLEIQKKNVYFAKIIKTIHKIFLFLIFLIVINNNNKIWHLFSNINKINKNFNNNNNFKMINNIIYLSNSHNKQIKNFHQKHKISQNFQVLKIKIRVLVFMKKKIKKKNQNMFQIFFLLR